MISEYENALSATPSADCRFGECQGCGVCDFDRIKPVYLAGDASTGPVPGKIEPFPHGNATGSFPDLEMRCEIVYSKTGAARFFGHLEMVNIFTRAIRRTGLKIKFTEGFHPKPKLSFHNPLPVGMESEEESFYITFREFADCEEMVMLMNRQLPAGLLVTGCAKIAASRRPLLSDIADYRVTIPEEFDASKISAFNDAQQWLLSRTTKKGRKKQINLKESVLNIKKTGPGTLHMRLKSAEGLSVRPADVIQSVFQLPDTIIRLSEFIKEKQTPDPS